MNKKCYIVYGITGEYGDRFEWVYKVFRTPKKAQVMCELLNGKLDELGIRDWVGDMTHQDRDVAIEKMSLFDPKCMVDYTGSEYYIKECDFEE